MEGLPHQVLAILAKTIATKENLRFQDFFQPLGNILQEVFACVMICTNIIALIVSTCNLRCFWQLNQEQQTQIFVGKWKTWNFYTAEYLALIVYNEIGYIF